MTEPTNNGINEPFLSRWARRKKLTEVTDSNSSETTVGSNESLSPADADLSTALNNDDSTLPGVNLDMERSGDVPDISEQQLEETDHTENDYKQNEEPEVILTDEDMPSIDSLTKDSDVSCFLNKGVSDSLRKKALRHLFMLPAFNIRDGLNDYDEDYTVFEPLGDTITSDMKFHAARKAREEEARRLALQQEELEAESNEAEHSSTEPTDAEIESSTDETEANETGEPVMAETEELESDSSQEDSAAFSTDKGSGDIETQLEQVQLEKKTDGVANVPDRHRAESAMDLDTAPNRTEVT